MIDVGARPDADVADQPRRAGDARGLVDRGRVLAATDEDL
jgi:hypothetical protein